MSQEKKISASDVIANGARTAQFIKGATKTGKTVAAAAKGASAGGVYGAAASVLWENRRFVAKVLAALSFVLIFPILFIAMLPALIFGDIGAKEESDALNNNTVIMENIDKAQIVINDALDKYHNEVIEKVNKEIEEQPDGTSSQIIDNYVSSVVLDTNRIISMYCASKDKWDEIKLSDLEKTMKKNKKKLFDYSVKKTTSGSGESAVTTYTYTIEYLGDENIAEYFELDEEKKKLAENYAENFITFLYGRGLLNGTAAVSPEVEAYSETITKYAEENNISEFIPVIKCIMMAESGGKGTDVMQCSECPYNEKYDNKPNAIKDPDYSIEIGIKYFAKCLEDAECKSPTDIPRLSLALQGYNYGNGYISWAKKNYGGYSQANALEFSNKKKAELGTSVYGNPDYVSAVLKYYLDSSMSGGGGVGWGSPFPGKNWNSAVKSEYGYRTDPVTKKKGSFHAGIDIGYSSGTVISAVKAGTVVAVNYYTTGYGYHVIIDHGDGFKTLYGHCSSLLVTNGQKVTKGQAIAKVGSTGKSTGPHLHLNVYKNGETVNPRNYITS